MICHDWKRCSRMSRDYQLVVWANPSQNPMKSALALFPEEFETTAETEIYATKAKEVGKNENKVAYANSYIVY